jgi:ERCC4-type nuclease
MTTPATPQQVRAFVDIRERELLPLLSPWTARQLPVGDIWIGLSGEEVGPAGLVIERKTTDDLEASLLDGRYREQRTRLSTYCAQQGARAAYVIEGPMDRLWGKMTAQALQKVLNRLALRYGIAVFHTESVEGTAELCRLFAAQMAEEPAVFAATAAAGVAYGSTVAISKRENRDNPRAWAAAALQGCPGVSNAAAEAILAAFGGTFAGVWAAEEAALAGVIVGKRRLGPAVAKRLFKNLHGGN